MRARGVGGARDIAPARRLLEAAAAQDDRDAQIALARLLRATASDDEGRLAALDWYEVAAARAGPDFPADARRELAELRQAVDPARAAAVRARPDVRSRGRVSAGRAALNGLRRRAVVGTSPSRHKRAMTTERRQPKFDQRMEAVRLRGTKREAPPHVCAWPGCERSGDYPAPRSRERLRDFIWFCLEHVREYNRRWDYFAGMSPAEIDAHRAADYTWHRPTWRLGAGFAGTGFRFRDVHGLFGEDGPGTGRTRPRTRGEEMMAVLGLEPGFSLAELKQRYKTLVKKYHPDLNGGDKAAEERLKSIVEAYTYLVAERLYVADAAACRR